MAGQPIEGLARPCYLLVDAPCTWLLYRSWLRKIVPKSMVPSDSPFGSIEYPYNFSIRSFREPNMCGMGNGGFSVVHWTGRRSSHLVRPIVTLFVGVSRCSHHGFHHGQTSKNMSAHECWSDDATPSGERHLNNDIVQSDTINVEGHFISNVFLCVRLVVLLRHLWPIGPYYSSSSEGAAERSSAMRCALRARSWRRRAAFLPGFSSRTAMFSLQCGQFITLSLWLIEPVLPCDFHGHIENQGLQRP